WFMPAVFPPYVAGSMRDLAPLVGVSGDRLDATVAAFNRAVRPGVFDPGVLDTCRTEGLTPNKSHWAQTINEPPFWGYPLRPGITFTYLGLKVDARARRDVAARLAAYLRARRDNGRRHS